MSNGLPILPTKYVSNATIHSRTKKHLWISGSPRGRAHWDPRYTATSHCIFHRRFPDSLEAPGQPGQGLQVILWGHLRFTMKQHQQSDIMCSYSIHIPFIFHQHSYSIISYYIQFIMDTASCPSLPHRWCQPRRTKQQLDQLNHTSHHQPYFLSLSENRKPVPSIG